MRVTHLVSLALLAIFGLIDSDAAVANEMNKVQFGVLSCIVEGNWRAPLRCRFVSHSQPDQYYLVRVLRYGARPYASQHNAVWNVIAPSRFRGNLSGHYAGISQLWGGQENDISLTPTSPGPTDFAYRVSEIVINVRDSQQNFDQAHR